MNLHAVKIALPKLFLWSEPSRFQEYAEALGRAEPGRGYTRVEIERELLDIVPTLRFQHGAARGRRTDGLVNLYGLERSGDRWRLNGLGLLSRNGGRIAASGDGLRLGALYREDPQGAGWAEELARILALREPRSRLVLLLMCAGGELVAGFSDTDAASPIELNLGDGRALAIRWSGCDEFNDLLAQHGRQALGPFWTQTLGLDPTAEVSWEGVVHGRPPSTNSLSTALRRSLGLFHHLDLFEGDQGRWTLDAGSLARRLGPEVAQSFGVSSEPPRAKLSDDAAFSRALADTVDVDGYVIVSRLANRFGELLDVPASERAVVLDSFVRGAMYHDRLRVLERHSGQPRMGRGLLGESHSRRVRLDFHADGPPPTATPGTSSLLGHARENSGGDR